MSPISRGFFGRGLRQQHHVWRALRAFLFLFNLHTLLLCAITCAFTYWCARNGWTYDIDSQLFVIAVNFPVTFAISSAFTRRERVLGFAAELKASAVSIFYAFRDFPQVFPPNGGGGGLRAAGRAADGTFTSSVPIPPRYPHTLGDNDNPWAREARAVLIDFLAAARDYLSAPSAYESIGEARLLEHHKGYFRDLILGGPRSSRHGGGVGGGGSRARLLQPTPSLTERVRRSAHEQPGHEPLMRLYSALSRLHVLNEHLSHAARYGRGGEGGISRVAQYIRFMSAQFEQLRTVKDYRTPSQLRSCCAVLIHLGCFALAPFFLHRGSCEDWGAGGGASRMDGACPAPYVNAILYVCISMLLLNVQAGAEHPFDADGCDDIFFELSEELFEVATLPSDERGPVSLDGRGGGVLFGPAVAAAREVEAEMVRLDHGGGVGGDGLAN